MLYVGNRGGIVILRAIDSAVCSIKFSEAKFSGKCKICNCYDVCYYRIKIDHLCDMGIDIELNIKECSGFSEKIK